MVFMVLSSLYSQNIFSDCDEKWEKCFLRKRKIIFFVFISLELNGRCYNRFLWCNLFRGKFSFFFLFFFYFCERRKSKLNFLFKENLPFHHKDIFFWFSLFNEKLSEKWYCDCERRQQVYWCCFWELFTE